MTINRVSIATVTVSTLRDIPHSTTPCEKKSVRTGTNFAVDGRDTKPSPFGDARPARRLRLAEVTENAGQKMRPRRREKALVANDFVVTQKDVVDGVHVVELITLPSVCPTKIGPPFPIDEDRVPEAKSPFHEGLMLVDIVSVDNDEHLVLLRWLLWTQEFSKS